MQVRLKCDFKMLHQLTSIYIKYIQHIKSKPNHLICFKINQSDWLIRLEKILVILDNLGWYCDVTVFIRQRQIQIVA